ncbi:MAG: DUF2783 domain-containing protein [Alphaproteobacteria bacterium]
MARKVKKTAARTGAGRKAKPAKPAADVLKRDLTIAHPDDLYEALIKAHEGLDDEKSRLVSARLIFLLANQIGDERILFAAIKAARDGV